MIYNLGGTTLEPDIFGELFSQLAPTFDIHVPDVYQYIRVITRDMSLNRRAAIAAAARSSGFQSSVDREIQETQGEILAHSPLPPIPDLHTYQADLNNAESELETLDEKVATERGRMQKEMEWGLDPSAISTYKRLLQEWAEAKARATAAKERLQQAEQQQYRNRTSREAHLRLTDKLHNLERKARSELVTQLEETIDHAISCAPGTAKSLPEATDSIVALAIARVATVKLPIVLVSSCFSSPHSAAEYLRSPIIWM